MGNTSVSYLPAERLGVEEASNLDWIDGVETSEGVASWCPAPDPETCPIWFIREIAKLGKLEEMSRPVSCLISKWHLKQSGIEAIYLSLLRKRALYLPALGLHLGSHPFSQLGNTSPLPLSVLWVCPSRGDKLLCCVWKVPQGWASWDGHSLSEGHSCFFSLWLVPR